ncbi:hypothetical protein [Bacillus suaedae]|uniref:Uncharacterized protein n=1 Tax=Halalkalibacter suaedae TaxID=2822140 RepID=A0A940WW45_9BACI|nr:hypothetical protein [Bacillus suaedae]MBP3951677.1 hypothetical protein [Bacillus suaedae]
MNYYIMFGLALVIGLLFISVTGFGFNLFMFLPLIIYLFAIAFVVWFAVSFINIQRKRNDLLAEISNKLERKDS